MFSRDYPYFISELIGTCMFNTIIPLSDSEFYWIGGKYIAEDGAWEWASDNRPFNYTAWHRRKQKNMHSFENTDITL